MRLTTDTPKNNLEMALNLFYVKDKDVWVRGYGKNGADISLLDLTREILSYQCPYVESDISDDDLIEMMPEWLFDDVRSTEHVVGLLYQAAWVCAELREDLKQFEDTGLTPKEVTALGGLFDYALKESKTLTEQLTLLKRIRELAEADKEGRVVVLPCRVGDTVWRIVRDGEPHITRDEVRDMCFADDMTLCVELVGGRVTFTEKFGKTVFLSREEAEKALQEMEGKKDGNETSM